MPFSQFSSLFGADQWPCNFTHFVQVRGKSTVPVQWHQDKVDLPCPPEVDAMYMLKVRHVRSFLIWLHASSYTGCPRQALYGADGLSSSQHCTAQASTDCTDKQTMMFWHKRLIA